MLDLLIQAEPSAVAVTEEVIVQGNPWSSLIMIFMLIVGIPGMIIGIFALIKLINRRMK